MVIFWASFLPLSNYWTWDKKFSNSPKANDNTRIFNIATVGFLLQLVMIFFYAGLTKDDAGWWQNYDAVYNALQQGNFTKPFGNWIASNIELSKFLTKFSVWGEILFPLLLILPFKNWITRSFGLLGLFGLSFGFYLSFMLGFFPWIMIIFIIGAIPTEIFDKLSGKKSAEEIYKPGRDVWTSEKWITGTLVLVIGFSWWNNWHNTYNYNAPALGEPTRAIMPIWAESMVNIPRIDQRWWMFTLESWEDFWLDVEGIDKDGNTFVDPFKWYLNQKDVSFSSDKPKNYRKEIGTQLWNRFIYDVKDRKVTGEWFLYNLCKKYNAANPSQQIETLKLHLTKEKILGFNERGAPQTSVINQWSCDE